MRIAVATLGFLIAAPAVAQTMNEELARLREHLTVPEQVSIRLADRPTLPVGGPLKVYIAMGLDMGVRSNFIKWIEEWNKKDAKKYGSVEIVSDMAASNVILARYTLREKVTEETNTYTAPGTIYDPGTGKMVTRPVPHTYSTSSVPVYGYIIANKGDALEILMRYADRASVEETRRSGQSLRDDFFKLIKARSAAQKNK